MKKINLLCTVLIGVILIIPQSKATEVENESSASLPKSPTVVPPEGSLTSASAPLVLRLRAGKSLGPGEELRLRPANNPIFKKGKEFYTRPGDPRAYLRDKKPPAVKESGSEG